MAGVLPGIRQEQMFNIWPPECPGPGVAGGLGVRNRSQGIWGYLSDSVQGWGRGNVAGVLSPPQPDSSLWAWPHQSTPPGCLEGPSCPESVPRETNDPVRSPSVLKHLGQIPLSEVGPTVLTIWDSRCPAEKCRLGASWGTRAGKAGISPRWGSCLSGSSPSATTSPSGFSSASKPCSAGTFTLPFSLIIILLILVRKTHLKGLSFSPHDSIILPVGKLRLREGKQLTRAF